VIRVVVLDFDGVIVESADIKTEAFVALFPEYPEHHAAIRRYHLRHAGISRHIKITAIRHEILGERGDPARDGRLAGQFRELVEERVARAALVPGVRAFLAAARRRFHLYAASGTPQDELRRLAERHGIAPDFAGIFGSPETKPAMLRRIATAEPVTPHEMVMVGDGESDRDAAHETGVHFVARVIGPGPLADCRWRIPDLTELAATIDRIDAA